MNKIVTIFKKVIIPYCIFSICLIFLYLSLFWLVFIKLELLNVNDSEYYRFWMPVLATAISVYFFLKKNLTLLKNLSSFYRVKIELLSVITIFPILVVFQTYLTDKKENLTNLQFPIYFFLVGTIIIFLLLLLFNIDEIRLVKYVNSKITKDAEIIEE